MLLRFQMQTPVLLGKLAVPFLDSWRILEKGTVFLLEFSGNYQFCFAIKPEYPGAYRLSDAPAFLFSEIYHLGGLRGVRNHV